MELKDLRNQIDDTDQQIVELFAKRMDIAAEIAARKKEANAPVLNTQREREVLNHVCDLAPEDYKDYTRVLFSMLMGLSRSYQHKITSPPSKLEQAIQTALESTPKMFPEQAVIACQGVEGAYSQIAAEKLFATPNIMYFNSFESVFSAVEKGLCQYGVLPLENSTAGSVSKVYDLMRSRDFYIVKSARVHVSHTLLAKPGVKLENIKEIFSHEQAINQCDEFLSGLKGVKVTPCENTAVAAKMVAESDRDDVAALSARQCAALYGLNVLSESVNNAHNYTRFICISKKPEIYPGADRTSLMMVVPHRPGSLYSVLSQFFTLGINLTKLESRPIPGRDFEFMFYFDIDASVYSPKLAQLICELEGQSEEFKYLGSYLEVI